MYLKSKNIQQAYWSTRWWGTVWAWGDRAGSMGWHRQATVRDRPAGRLWRPEGVRWELAACGCTR